MPGVLLGFVHRFLAGLERPLLFKLAAGLFLIDLLVPDLVPFVDEVLLGVLTLLFSKQKPMDPSSQQMP